MTLSKPDCKPSQDCRNTALRMAFLFVSFLFSLFAFSQPAGEFKVRMIAPEGYSVGKITVSIQIDKTRLKGKTDNTGVCQFTNREPFLRSDRHFIDHKGGEKY